MIWLFINALEHWSCAKFTILFFYYALCIETTVVRKFTFVEVSFYLIVYIQDVLCACMCSQHASLIGNRLRNCSVAFVHVVLPLYM